MNAIERMSHDLFANTEQYHTITTSDYDQFKKQWVFYTLKDLRYGQAFIEHFNLSRHSPLYFFKDKRVAKRWIESNYIKHEQ